jgi:hypothetical protein
MEKLFFDLCEGYRGVASDQIDIETLWSLVLPQALVLFHFDGEKSYQFYLTQLTTVTSTNLNLWTLLLSAAILFEHYLPRDEWRDRFLRDYSSFLSKASSELLIPIQSFLTKQIFGNKVSLSSEQYISFLAPLVQQVYSSADDQQNLLQWLSHLLLDVSKQSNQHIAILLTTSSELSILTAITNRIHSSPRERRSELTKLLLMPYLSLLITANAVTPITIQDIWTSLCLEFHKSGDLHVASIIGCSLAELLVGSSNSDLHLEGLWDLIFELLNDSKQLVHRKRGAHIMQLYAIYLERGKSSWCHSFLLVYRQLEGCSTMHLVSQVRTHPYP